MKSGVKGGITAVIKGIFAGAFLLQLIPALIWGALNITTLPGFLETRDRFATGALTGIPGRIIIYILQFLICYILLYLASAAFFRGFSGEKADGKQNAITAAFVFTNPFYFPLVFSLLPDALSVALLIYAAAYAFLWFKKREEDKNTVFLVPVLAGLVLLIILSRKIFVCGIVVITWILIWGLILLLFSKEKEKKTKRVLTAAGCIAAALLLLCAAYFGNRIAGKGSFIEGNDSQSFEEYGEPYYSSLRNGEGTEKKFLKEWFSETLSPALLAFDKYPLGNTLNPYNENVLWQNTPKLTRFFFGVGRLAYQAGVFCFLLGWLLSFFMTDPEGRKKDLKNILFFAGILLPTAFCFALLATTEFNYRNTLFTYLAWGIFAAGMNYRNVNRTLMFLGKDTKWEKQP